MKKINISIDDVSPHPSSSTLVLKQCFEILKYFNDVKFTLFIPMAYWRTIGETATSAPLAISQFSDFCDELKALPKENFELAYHGFYHGIPGKSNNDEFQSIDYDNALYVIEMMKMEAYKAGIFDDFKRILRPPAWRMCPAAFEAAVDCGFSLFALSPDDYALATYGEIYKKLNHVMYNVCPPQKPLVLFDKTEIVYHACQWDKNFLSEQLTKELIEFLKDKKGQYEFCFMGDLNGKI